MLVLTEVLLGAVGSDMMFLQTTCSTVTFLLIEKYYWVWENGSSVKYLLYKTEELSLKSNHSCKRSGMAAQVCYLREARDRDRYISGAHVSFNLAELLYYRFYKKLY